MAKKSIREKIEDFRPMLEIDKNSLDEEIVRHPQIYFDVSELHVLACARRDYLKEQIALKDAELASKHRRRLEKESGRAVNDAVSAAVISDPKHQAAAEAYNKSKEVADLAAALKDSFYQRSYMLRELSGLFISNYFQSTTVNSAAGNTTEIKAERNKRLMSEARERGGNTIKNSARRKRD